MSKDRISTSGGDSLGQNPFGSLSNIGLPSAPSSPSGSQAAVPAKEAKNRGRVEVRIEKAGRGGKSVTVASGFVGIGQPEKEDLAKKMQRACGSGGTVKEGRIEIQGEKREQVMKILSDAGFRPVAAGG